MKGLINTYWKIENSLPFLVFLSKIRTAEHTAIHCDNETFFILMI